MAIVLFGRLPNPPMPSPSRPVPSAGIVSACASPQSGEPRHDALAGTGGNAFRAAAFIGPNGCAAFLQKVTASWDAKKAPLC